jgi:hypothetical protein
MGELSRGGNRNRRTDTPIGSKARGFSVCTGTVPRHAEGEPHTPGILAWRCARLQRRNHRDRLRVFGPLAARGVRRRWRPRPCQAGQVDVGQHVPIGELHGRGRRKSLAGGNGHSDRRQAAPPVDDVGGDLHAARRRASQEVDIEGDRRATGCCSARGAQDDRRQQAPKRTTERAVRLRPDREAAVAPRTKELINVYVADASVRPMTVVDADQHLFESRSLWADHMPAGGRDGALSIEDDDVGNAWLTWRGQRIVLADVTVPTEVDRVGRRLQRALRGEPPEARYDDELPPELWDPDARTNVLGTLGVDEAVLFPNYGLAWERTLEADLDATRSNMSAWNRWTEEVASARLHPVAHLTLRDANWLDAELRSLSQAGVRQAMISPGLVDGRPLSHRDHDRIWAAFVENGITPAFHVANVTRPFDDAWFESDPEPTNPALASVFLWSGPAMAIADLVLNGVFERHPDLRLGVFELSAVWLPLFLQYLDGGYRFHRRLHGASIVDLPIQPSEYVKRHVRVAAFAYERPDLLMRGCGDMFMACSDYPHSEGTATPLADYAAANLTPDAAPGLFADNLNWLLRA